MRGFLFGPRGRPVIDPKRQHMSSLIHAPANRRPVPIPIGEIVPWLAFGGFLALLCIYFIGAEQGAASLFSGHYLHEFVHDGRHIMAFPCH
jgi:hypothetical protein